MDKEEYDELMSRKLWFEVTKGEELLEFDFWFISLVTILNYLLWKRLH
jgi:hypothetical protein